MSRDRRRIIDPNLPEDLRFARAGQHFVVFIEHVEQVIIIEFLHSRVDATTAGEPVCPEKQQGSLTPTWGALGRFPPT